MFAIYITVNVCFMIDQISSMNIIDLLHRSLEIVAFQWVRKYDIGMETVTVLPITLLDYGRY